MLIVDQINSRTRLEHDKHLGWHFDWSEKQDGLRHTIVANAKTRLGKSGHEIAMFVENTRFDQYRLNSWAVK